MWYCTIFIGNLPYSFRFMFTKNVTSNSTEGTSTCSEENIKPKIEVEKSENDEQPPPEKKKRLSNREYKKLMKGQNKVSLEC